GPVGCAGGELIRRSVQGVMNTNQWECTVSGPVHGVRGIAHDDSGRAGDGDDGSGGDIHVEALYVTALVAANVFRIVGALNVKLNQANNVIRDIVGVGDRYGRAVVACGDERVIGSG